MKIGMFGYPGDHIERTKAVYQELKDAGADKIVCLGGLVWGGKRDDSEAPPATVLRWLRSNDIPTLANDSDRQVAGWRLQALANTTGYVQVRVRKFLSAITREDAQWIYSRPVMLPFDKILCCTDNLTVDALFPVPLTRFNATKLFTVLEQRAAFFPSANGPALIVRKESDGTIEAENYSAIEVRLDSPRVAAIVGGVVGATPLNTDVSWGALVDTDANLLSLICLDAKTRKPIPERAALLLQRSEVHWSE